MSAVSRNDYDIEHAKVSIYCRRCEQTIDIEMEFESDEPTTCKCGREWHFRTDVWGWQEAEHE